MTGIVGCSRQAVVLTCWPTAMWDQAGGIIARRNVGITAVDGNVTNLRTVRLLDRNTVAGVLHQDFSDNATRIETANGLTVNAGNDVSNQGSVLESGGATSISAGRDMTLASIALITSASAAKTTPFPASGM